MPQFLTTDQLYRLLQRELPPSTYPDGAPSGYDHTADYWATASVYGDLYANLAVVYANKFPQTANENISDWETMVFGQIAPASLSLAQRQARIVAKMQLQPSLSRPNTLALVNATIPEIGSANVEIIRWADSDGGWLLDESQLEVDTFINGQCLVDAVGPTLCDQDPAEFGKSATDWAIAQQEAYTYEVRIYNYTLSSAQRTALDATLTAAEKAGSTHVITDSLTDADRHNGST